MDKVHTIIASYDGGEGCEYFDSVIKVYADETQANLYVLELNELVTEIRELRETFGYDRNPESEIEKQVSVLEEKIKALDADNKHGCSNVDYRVETFEVI